MAKKRTRRIYLHEDGKWRLETTTTTGKVYATLFDTKEQAEQLLALSEKYTGKYVLTDHEGQLHRAKVTNTGLLHHKDGTISEMLYLKYDHCSGSWLRTATDCELITIMEGN